MAPTDRKRQRSHETLASPRSKLQATALSDNEFPDASIVDAELSSINNLLQEDETSQKQTWQIGKRVKKLVESHEHLPVATQLDAYFLWGTALARLASLNEDPTLAEAAADKFELMTKLSQDGANEDAVDAALGAVGFSLWGSSLLIVATETQSRHVLDEALVKFQRAVEIDGGTTFETRFQYAKALKEGGDLVSFLEVDGKEGGMAYYKRALRVCGKLEEIYVNESAKKEQQLSEKVCDSEGDDTVTREDFAEAKLLEAVLQSLLEDSTSIDEFHRTLALYRKAILLDPDSTEALMEMTNYLAARCFRRGEKPSGIEWTTLFEDLEATYKVFLNKIGFELRECHDICTRKDTKDQTEREEEKIDERVPHLLQSLGKGLAAFVQAFPRLKDRPNTKGMELADTRFMHAVEILRTAHHFHDKLGGYYLACLYASPAYQDEQQCRIWLETADSYGALEDEFDVQNFTTMHEKPWFKRLIHPPEPIEDEQ